MPLEAKVICDSISPQGKRITTFKLRYPKFIHGELMTHRVFSRNASSSRAVPTRKLRGEAWRQDLRATPIQWGGNQKGMQAGGELTGWRLNMARWGWGFAARTAVLASWLMEKAGLHKQWANRPLEPFTHINVIVTATEWDNFFGLRLHKDAQPEMRVLAEQIWAARKASTPKLLQPGQWHLPFIEWNGPDADFDTRIARGPIRDQCIRVSVARCARVSYESFETGKRSTVEEDLKLYDRLMAGLSDPSQPLHASPAEHQATPDELLQNYGDEDYESGWQNRPEWGNFVGWRQYRKMLKGEQCAPIPEEFCE